MFGIQEDTDSAGHQEQERKIGRECNLTGRMAVSHSVEQILRSQISEIAAPSNFELHSWWNWDPSGRSPAFNTASAPKQAAQSSLEPPISSDRRSGASGKLVVTTPNQIEIAMEVIVADLHDRVIDSCRHFFTELGLPATLVQAPLQLPLLEAFTQQQDSEPTDTFVVFGGYGNGMVNSGVQKQLYHAFPQQMQNLQEQATGGAFGDDTASIAWQDVDASIHARGQVRVALPAVTGGSGRVYLVSCAAYPRCQQPSEHHHVMRMFTRALHFVTDIASQPAASTSQLEQPAARNITVTDVTGKTRQLDPLLPVRPGHPHAAGSGCAPDSDSASVQVDHGSLSGQGHYQVDHGSLSGPGQGGVPVRPRSVRVVTHGVGSFVGHDRPELFGSALAHAAAAFARDTNAVVT